jgi:hypothetical protein
VTQRAVVLPDRLQCPRCFTTVATLVVPVRDIDCRCSGRDLHHHEPPGSTATSIHEAAGVDWNRPCCLPLVVPTVRGLVRMRSQEVPSGPPIWGNPRPREGRLPRKTFDASWRSLTLGTDASVTGIDHPMGTGLVDYDSAIALPCQTWCPACHRSLLLTPPSTSLHT